MERLMIITLEVVDPKRELDVYRSVAQVLGHAADHGWVKDVNLQGVFEEVPTERIHP